MRRTTALALVALVAFASTSAALAEGLPAHIGQDTLVEKVAPGPATAMKTVPTGLPGTAPEGPAIPVTAAA